MSEQLIPTPGVFGENGNFLLERELGAGGMGGVYMGRDKMLDRPVAVKVMLKELGSDAEFVERFKKEAQSAARLIHPNIAQIYSYGICDGMPYMAMELASGGSLFSLMNANPGKTDIARVLKICQQVAQALQCASDQGLVHGDVKPENILFDANGNAKLVDFGLAGMQKETDEIWGTPYYIAPEKVQKEPIDFRADMYSLGGTLYHALTGVAPFEGEDSVAVVRKRFEGAPRKPSAIRPELTPAIDKLVLTMLALDKEKRYPSFEALIEAFKSVLTSGLTANLSAAAAPATGKKTMVAGKRRMATAARGRRLSAVRTKSSVASASAAVADASEAEEEESGGNLAAKVIGVVFGVIALVGLIVGGLVWYQIADKKGRAADEQNQIDAGIDKARLAIADTVERATKFADEFDAFAEKAVVECQKPTDELMKILPEDQRPLPKPPMSKELLDAIASTNEVPAVTNAAPAATATNAVASATNDVQQATNDVQQAEESVAEAVQPSPVVMTMIELWNRAYGCQASAIRLRQKVRKIVEKGSEAEAIKEPTRENMTALAALSATVVDLFEQVKGSPDVENVKKGITFIKTKGEKAVSQTLRQIKLDKLRAEQEEKAKRLAEEEAARKQKLEEERKAKIEQEMSAAKEKFDAVVSQGCLRQLDWKSALRQLQALKDETSTAEGQLAIDLQIRKVNDMKAVQDIFIKNLKGYAFRNGRQLRAGKVEKIDEKEIVISRPNNQSKVTLSWPKFYKDYVPNLNEVLNTFIVNTRKPSSKIKMTLREWADAMTGAALTMQLVCSEATGAQARSEALMKDVVGQFPDYAKTAKEIFPDMTFEAGEEE